MDVIIKVCADQIIIVHMKYSVHTIRFFIKTFTRNDMELRLIYVGMATLKNFYIYSQLDFRMHVFGTSIY